MALNMKTLTQALAKTAAVIEKTVQTTVQEVTGPKPLQDYELLDQIGSAGPGMAWKLYSAKARDSSRPQQYPTVCVWVLDKRVLSEARTRAGLSKSAEDSFLDLIRADAGRLVRLRHPGVVHVVQALDENKNAMAMVTEPLFASVANVVGNVENVVKVPKELNGLEMGLLEIKHGLLQIAESLNFLHSNAHLIHRAISPENVLITSNGAWKLAGFGFAISADQTSNDMATMQAFHYAEYDVEDSMLPLQPSLNYTAPELVRSKSSLAGCPSDIFSFGCLAYHLIARKPFFDCHGNVKMYMNSLTYLSTESFASIPRELVPDLQRMLSSNESFRPTALEFTGSPFFRDDTRLRALRFLDHMLERDNMQKSDFLKALSDMWKDFDSRILRYKVLPPLCAELRNLVMQPMILPMVLTIAESQDKHDFELSTLPSLVPCLSTAAGDTLLLLVKHADLIINKTMKLKGKAQEILMLVVAGPCMNSLLGLSVQEILTNQEQLITNVLPLIVRAYDDNDARIQEEVLKKSVSLAKQLDTQLVKQTILPRVHGLALKTTVAAVRVNAMLCFGEMVQTLDKHAVLEILQTIQRCTAVDRSAPTLMCTLGVANSILKQYGIEFVAEHVLPLLTPLLTAQQLNVQQFAKYMLFVKDILRKIEEKRGVTVSDSGLPEMKSSLVSNGSQSQLSRTASETIVPTIKSRPAWDEDWGPTSKGHTPPQNSTSKISSAPAVHGGQSIAGNSTQTNSVVTTSLSSIQTVASCLPVDIEWPPRNSTGGTPRIADSGMQATTGASPTSSLDDADPFADWPPRPSGSLGNALGASNNGVVGSSTNKYGTSSSMSTLNSLNFQTNNASWTLNNQNTSEPMRQNHGTSTFNSNSLGGGGITSRNSIGFQKQNQGIPSQHTYDADKKFTDLGSIFVPSKNDHNIALRLAPPPATAVGRGRGRGRGVSSASRSTQNKSSSGQPPLMDLL